EGMKVGLTGFAGAGKTTVFTALTGLEARPAGGAAVTLGVIKVPDPRVDKLAEVYAPRKQTYAEVMFVDFPPARTTERRAVLEAGKALRTLPLVVDERSQLAGFAFLSLRPLLIVLNVAEGEAAAQLPEDVGARAAAEGAEALVLAAGLESEIAQLEPADREAF